MFLPLTDIRPESIEDPAKVPEDAKEVLNTA
jgi:hypothetical protein